MNERAEPVMMTSDEPIRLGFGDLLDIVSVIEAMGLMNELKRTIATERLEVLAPKETVNSFKSFFASHPTLASSEIGDKVMYPPAAPLSGPERFGPTRAARCCGFSSDG